MFLALICLLVPVRFRIAAPKIWNSLEFSSVIRSFQILDSFRKHLEPHMFQSAFYNPLRLTRHFFLLIYTLK